MTLASMYDEVAEFRKRFKTALMVTSDKEVQSIIRDVIKKTSSVYEETIIVENLKEVYGDYLNWLLEEKKSV